jgi:hypothetical protein
MGEDSARDLSQPAALSELPDAFRGRRQKKDSGPPVRVRE